MTTDQAPDATPIPPQPVSVKAVVDAMFAFLEQQNAHRPVIDQALQIAKALVDMYMAANNIA